MKQKKIIWWLGCLIISAVVLSVFAARTSPLYSLLMGDYTGNTAADAMLTAKYWLQGRIPYRDLFVMENPLYLLIQLLGWFFAGRTGIFILEICNLTIFLIWLEKTLALFVTGRQAKVLSLLSLIPYAAFCAGGDSDVEWCLGLLSIGLSLLLHAIVQKTFSPKKWFALGCISAAIGLIHPLSGAMLYGGILAQPLAALKMDGSKKNWKNIVYFLIGLVIPVIIVVCYFGVMGAGYDLWMGMVVYPFQEMCANFSSCVVVLHKGVKCCLALPLFLLGVHKVFGARRNQAVHEAQMGNSFVWMAVAAILLQMLNDNSWCCFLAVIPAMLLAIAVWLKEWNEKKTVKWIGAALEAVFFFLLCAVPLKNYLYYLHDGVKEVLYEFCEDMNSYRVQFEDCQVLAIDTDSSLFLYLDEPPVVKYFTRQSELSEYDSHVAEEVSSYQNSVGRFDVMLTTERGWVGQYFEHFYLVQVYCKTGGNICVYMPYDEEI